MVKILSCLSLTFLIAIAVCGETINIGETTMVQDKFLRQMIFERMMQNPDDSVVVEKMSQETALAKLKSGELDLMVVDSIDFVQDNSLKYVCYNSVYLGVIVNKENPLKHITLADLRKIFIGEATSWAFLIKDNNHSIHRFGMDENSAVYFIANRLFPVKNAAQVTMYYPINAPEVMVESNENAIGLIELPKNNSRKLSKVKLLPIIDKGDEKEATQLNYYFVFLAENADKLKEFLPNE